MKLYNLLRSELVGTNLTSTTLEALLREIIHHLKMLNLVSNEKSIVAKLMEREKLGSTSIGHQAAVPHTKLKELNSPIIFMGISRQGILYNAADKEPVHLIILVLSPNNSPILHLQILAAAAALIKKSKQLIKEMLSVETPEMLLDLIKKYETADD